MRPTTAIALTCATAVGVAALSAASVMSAASDGLSDTSLLKGANFQNAFAGNVASVARASDDPDAPIRTGRFDDRPAPVVLAGGAPEPAAPVTAPLAIADATPPAAKPVGDVVLAGLAPDSATDAARASEASQRPRGLAGTPMASMAAPGLPRSAFQPTGLPRYSLLPKSRVSFSVSSNETPFSPGSGLAFGARDERQSPASRQIPVRGRQFENRRLGLQVDVTPEKSRKGRWFIFAATSGDALGFNLFSDPAKSGRKTSWSVEKLAEYGKLQLGLGWRKGPMQISTVATRREIGAYGYSREDTVFGLSFTISGGKRLAAPKARRGMPRD